MSNNFSCPNCEIEIKLTESENSVGIVHCPECEKTFDLNFSPPKIVERDNYVELLTLMNQGDISLVKSILANSGIDYHVFDENFSTIDPLIQPARFYVNLKHVEDAKELFKDLDLNIFGVSNNE